MGARAQRQLPQLLDGRAGGFLQNVVNGYSGLRAQAARLDFKPVLPPSAGSVRLVGLHYAHSRFTLKYTSATMTLTLLDAAPGGLTLNTTEGGGRHSLSIGTQLKLPVVAFSLTATPTMPILLLVG